MEDLLREGSTVAFGPGLDEARLEDLVAALIAAEHADNDNAPGRAATEQLIRSVGVLYEHGWQPADLVHVVGKEQSPRVARLAGAVVLEQARQTSAMERAPEAWAAQLDALRDAQTTPVDQPVTGAIGVAPFVVTQWHQDQGQHVWDGWRENLSLIGQWVRLPALAALCPPPSAWRTGPTVRRHTAAPAPTSHADPKVLARIRALLAKAESTDFSAEADALTAKAQDMMTRHAIDAALLDDAHHLSGGIASRRVHLDSPYASTKVQLLSSVGEVNRVRILWDERWAIATIVGTPVDLDLVEMLFTSLLVQAVRAMTHEGAARQRSSLRDNGSRRSAGFRRAFLLAYAIRIGERLAEAGAHATAEAQAAHGAALVPVLARRSAEVDAEFSRLFPETRSIRRRSVDARGWHAGRAAADDAVIAAGQVDRERSAG